MGYGQYCNMCNSHSCFHIQQMEMVSREHMQREKTKQMYDEYNRRVNHERMMAGMPDEVRMATPQEVRVMDQKVKAAKKKPQSKLLLLLRRK